MRTLWTVDGIRVHQYLPHTRKTVIKVVTGVDPLTERLTYTEGILIGTFLLEGIATPSGFSSTITVALAERRLGISFNELKTGLNLSDGCYTLYNDTVPFDSSIIRAVLKSMDKTNYGKRIEKIVLNKIPLPIVNNVTLP